MHHAIDFAHTRSYITMGPIVWEGSTGAGEQCAVLRTSVAAPALAPLLYIEQMSVGINHGDEPCPGVSGLRHHRYRRGSVVRGGLGAVGVRGRESVCVCAGACVYVRERMSV